MGAALRVLNKVLETILQTGLVGSGDNPRPVSAEISADVGSFVADLIRINKPRVSLEVGLAYGVSALYICDALAKVGASKHYVIDPNQTEEWGSIGITNLHAAGFAGMVELREQMSHTALPQLLSEGVKIDFAFIDGWHVFDQVLVDFFFIDKLLPIGGVVAFDDSNWPGVRKALRFIVKNRNYEILGCSPSPWSRKDHLATTLQRITPAPIGAIMKAEISNPDGSIGLRSGSRCVALRKIADDDRAITYFNPF